MTGASEIGQGSETVLAQLVCEELGMPLSAVTVVNNDTDITPWDVGVHASRTTFIAGNSAIGAAQKAKAKIFAAASKLTGQTRRARIALGAHRGGCDRKRAIRSPLIGRCASPTRRLR
jgi:CO/xanthine dehydrogenase Mo-binding subunit